MRQRHRAMAKSLQNGCRDRFSPPIPWEKDPLVCDKGLAGDGEQCMNTPTATPLAQWRDAARACLERDDLQQAAQLFKRVLDEAPDDVEALQVVGTAQLFEADFAAAARTLRRALRVAPDLFVVRLRLGIALEQLGQSQEALTAYFGALRTAQSQGR